MGSRHYTGFAVCVTAWAAQSFVACSTTSDASAAVDASAATDSGAEAADSSIIEAAQQDGPDPSCPWLHPEGGSDSGETQTQRWCEPDAGSPPGCPASKPEGGAACTSPGLGCRYDLNATSMVVLTCNASQGTWTEVAHHCSDACELPDAAITPVDPSIACGSAPGVVCSADEFLTTQERADRALSELGSCCGLAETALTVLLVDGCAVSFQLARPQGNDAQVSCVGGLLAGRRWTCGSALACASAEWSTIR